MTYTFNGFSGNTTIQLISLQGRVLKTFKVKDSTNERLDIADVSGGTYLLAVRDEHGNKQTVKIVVVH